METAPRVAIVHEWVASRAGSEQVFESLANLWPDADLYALSRDPSVDLHVGDRHIRTTFLDNAVLRGRRGLTLPLMPLAWRSLGRGDYDLVITSHHAFAMSNRLAAGRQLAYVHSPARYVWSPEIDGRGSHPFLEPARKALQAHDRLSAARVTAIAANSTEVATRISRYWDRSATVIYPPVDTEYFAASLDDLRLDLFDQYILALGRWIPYKNHLTVIEVAERLRCPAIIAGSGPLRQQLTERARRASVPVRIVEAPSRAEVRELMARASALVFPTFEDFGIVPVEAMAAGTPVVALERGGATETVDHGRSGYLVKEHSPDAYAEGVEQAWGMNPDDCRHQADRFSQDVFRKAVRDWVNAS